MNRAHTLMNAGRLDVAATAFESAAETAAPEDKLELSRLSFEQLLRRGELERGLSKAREVLAVVGLKLPRSKRGAVASILAQRLMLRARGLKFDERPAEQVPSEILTRLDVAWSVCSGLALVDPILSKALQARYTREALAAGEPTRVLRALALEGGLSWRRRQQGSRVVRRAASLLPDDGGTIARCPAARDDRRAGLEWHRSFPATGRRPATGSRPPSATFATTRRTPAGSSMSPRSSASRRS